MEQNGWIPVLKKSKKIKKTQTNQKNQEANVSVVISKQNKKIKKKILSPFLKFNIDNFPVEKEKDAKPKLNQIKKMKNNNMITSPNYNSFDFITKPRMQSVGQNQLINMMKRHNQYFPKNVSNCLPFLNPKSQTRAGKMLSR